MQPPKMKRENVEIAMRTVVLLTSGERLLTRDSYGDNSMIISAMVQIYLSLGLITHRERGKFFLMEGKRAGRGNHSGAIQGYAVQHSHNSRAEPWQTLRCHVLGGSQSTEWRARGRCA